MNGVWELDSEKGARLLYAAGTPEAERWLAENSQPMPEDAPAPPIDPADLPEETDVEPVETVSAPKD